MRILQVTEASGGGTLGIVRTLSERLAAAGHEVALAYGRRPETPDALERLVAPEVQLAPLPWARRSVRAQLAAATALRRLVATWHPDVVHLHSSFAGAVGALALPASVPRLYTPHGSMLARDGDGRARRALFRAAERSIARRADTVGAVSASEAELVAGVTDRARVAVVENGIPELDPGAMPRAAARPEPLVAAMGRIGPARRPAASARILAEVAGVAAVRWIGGAPGDEAAPLQRAGVPVTGWLAHEQALAELSGATVLLHWSAWDGAPVAVLEAMARDVVVVASDIPPNREMLGPDQVCAQESEAIELIRRVVCDDDLRARMLGDQRRRGSRYGATAMATRWTALYERVLRTHGRPVREPVAPAPAAPTIEGTWT